MSVWTKLGGAFINALPSILSGATSYLFGARQQNQNTDKMLEAQEKSNKENREHNLMLAQLQNQWNVEQWQRQNDYNDPQAQISRLRSAGLNPDMIYGHGGITNLAASSPQMTSGAPSSPVDYSSLANKRTIGESIMQGLSIEQARANINAVKANTRKTLADAGLSEVALEYADAKEQLNMKISEEQFKLVEQQWQEVAQSITNKRAELDGISLDNARKMIENAYQADKYQKELDILAEQLKITKEQAANASRYFAAQVLGMEADNAWKDAAWIVEQRDGTATLIKYGGEILVDLMSNLSEWTNPRTWFNFGRNKGKKP